MAIHYKFRTQGQINCHTLAHTHMTEETHTHNLPTCSLSTNAISLIQQLHKCVDTLQLYIK